MTRLTRVASKAYSSCRGSVIATRQNGQNAVYVDKALAKRRGDRQGVKQAALLVRSRSLAIKSRAPSSPRPQRAPTTISAHPLTAPFPSFEDVASSGPLLLLCLAITLGLVVPVGAPSKRFPPPPPRTKRRDSRIRASAGRLLVERRRRVGRSAKSGAAD